MPNDFVPHVMEPSLTLAHADGCPGCIDWVRRMNEYHELETKGAVIMSERLVVPPHKASFTLSHNEHLNYYSTVEREIRDRPDWFDDASWVSMDEKAKAIATNEIWTAQWYPETPVGFHTLHASTLEALNAGLAALHGDQEG